ncbi:histidine ammonia-lyase/phenylalanine ammonia-lyase [Nonomuraea solani]|uniref:Histidine ammonia-lyase/phenylalanine ammonia-lyase n=1 Tax=Nonomuraea solani TaxID=1144553 RepID=A0A1H6DVU3_9ACTN|nr:aromatic amino acid ammonia-lyase [Nonomuraea solani]SEG89420.1 histidine ammonia-lyase/phenylalanine ammonia-lyase [Nonomuraea solani]
MKPDGKTVTLGVRTLTPEEITRFAERPSETRFVLDERATHRIDAGAALRQKLVDAGLPLYGVTTGFGDSARRVIPKDKAEALQRDVLAFHLAGVGPPAPAEVVRAAMVIRANCLARGSSGVRRELVELLLACVAHDLVPAVPQRGSVGASGDLTPLCYIANLLAGRGEVTVHGERRPADDALRERGLGPWEPEPKEALALVNGTSFSSAYAVITLERATRLVTVAELCTAMACESLCADRGHYDPVIHQHKPHPGQQASAVGLLALLDGPGLSRDHPFPLEGKPQTIGDSVRELELPIQEPYSLRCAPQVIGVLRDTLTWVRRWVTVEINSVDDNPLFDPGTEAVYTGGNFYAGHIGQAMDALKIAVANVGDLLDRQLQLLVDEKYNRGLTPNLQPSTDGDDPEAGVRFGFKAAQITCSALTAEALKSAVPATLFSRSTECHNQDKVSMGTIAARDAYAVVDLVEHVAAVHLLAGCQAIDLRGTDRAANAVQRMHRIVRDRVPALDDDRRMDADMEAVVSLIRTGALHPIDDGPR